MLSTTDIVCTSFSATGTDRSSTMRIKHAPGG